MTVVIDVIVGVVNFPLCTVASSKKLLFLITIIYGKVKSTDKQEAVATVRFEELTKVNNH